MLVDMLVCRFVTCFIDSQFLIKSFQLLVAVAFLIDRTKMEYMPRMGTKAVCMV